MAEFLYEGDHFAKNIQFSIFLGLKTIQSRFKPEYLIVRRMPRPSVPLQNMFDIGGVFCACTLLQKRAIAEPKVNNL